MESFEQRPQLPEIGATASRISRRIVQLHAKLYGRGPTKAKTFLEHEYALCILEEVFTTAENTLIAAGRGDHVQATRLAFQQAVEDQFIAILEEETQRSVRALVSQVHLPSNLSVELFLFAPDGGSTQGSDGNRPDG